MSEQVIPTSEDRVPPVANGEIVHWMERRPATVGAAGASAAVAGAFALGMAAAVAVLVLTHWLGPARELPVPRRR